MTLLFGLIGSIYVCIFHYNIKWTSYFEMCGITVTVLNELFIVRKGIVVSFEGDMVYIEYVNL